MKAGKITAKLRDAVPVCLMVNGAEVGRYKNIELPDEIKALQIMDFGFITSLTGKFDFNLHFDEGVLPEQLPEVRAKITRAERRAAKAASMENEILAVQGAAEEAIDAETPEVMKTEISPAPDILAKDSTDESQLEAPAKVPQAMDGAPVTTEYAEPVTAASKKKRGPNPKAVA